VLGKNSVAETHKLGDDHLSNNKDLIVHFFFHLYKFGRQRVLAEGLRR
jgi:hypothetical protein